MTIWRTFLCFLITGSAVVHAEQITYGSAPDICKQGLPQSLSIQLKKDYPNWSVVTYEDLGGWEDKLFEDSKASALELRRQNFTVMIGSSMAFLSSGNPDRK